MRNKFFLEISLLLASTLTILANAIIAPSLPLISNTFKDVRQVEILTKMMLTLPALTIAIVAPLVGRLLDRAGRIKVLMFSLVIYIVAGTSGFWLDNLWAILAGRFVLGLGVAGIMTVSTTLIGDYFTGEKREHFLGLQGVFVALGGLVFITTAGFLADINWRYTFLIYGFAVVVLFLAPIALYEPEIRSQTKNTSNGKDAASPVMWVAFLSAFLTSVAFYMVPVQLPFLLQKIPGITSNQVGLAVGSLPFAQAIASFFYKKIKKKFSFVGIYSLGFVPMAFGFWVIGFSQTYWQIITGILISGLGVGLLIPNSNLWVISLAPVQVRGKYIGVLTTATFMGMFLSPVIMQPIVSLLDINLSFVVLGVALAIISFLYWVGKGKIDQLEFARTVGPFRT